MSHIETFQLPLAAAEAYESKFVPAFFAEWAPRLLDAAGVGEGHTVLDVACGTGIVARTAAARVGATGRVVGVDLNEAMLTVARRVRPDLQWHQGDAAQLPFADRSFDVVVCQMALMFFADRAAALADMKRVAVPGGTVAIAVPAALQSQPAYGPFVDIVARHAGPDALSLMSTYWSCGNLEELRALVGSAGLSVAASQTSLGTARFPSIADFVSTEIESTPLVERISDETYRRIQEDARAALGRFTSTTGRLEVPLAAHIVSSLVP